MGKKKEQMPKEKKPFRDKRFAIISLALVSIVVSGFLFYQTFMQSPKVEFSFKAAIIDQVGENAPSSPESAREFNKTVTRILESAGFNVSYHKSESITVNFYKGLAKYNYGLIILRAHSALRAGETEIDFFTSERFKENFYRDMQDKGLLTAGNYTWLPGEFYFAITPKFIESLDGYFPNSIVIAMGCWSLKSGYEEMAQAFIKKGAKAYIGWTDAVSMSHSDNSTVRFLQYLLEKNMTINDAINECNKILDQEGYHGKLSSYPSEIGNYKLSDFAVSTVLNIFFNKSKNNILKITA
jgi:hypothetical protein